MVSTLSNSMNNGLLTKSYWIVSIILTIK